MTQGVIPKAHRKQPKSVTNHPGKGAMDVEWLMTIHMDNSQDYQSDKLKEVMALYARNFSMQPVDSPSK